MKIFVDAAGHWALEGCWTTACERGREGGWWDTVERGQHGQQITCETCRGLLAAYKLAGWDALPERLKSLMRSIR